MKKLEPDEEIAIVAPLLSALRITQALSSDPKTQAAYANSVQSSYEETVNRVRGPLMFEDMYGNRMGDIDFHIMIYKQLMGMDEDEWDDTSLAIRNLGQFD